MLCVFVSFILATVPPVRGETCAILHVAEYVESYTFQCTFLDKLQPAEVTQEGVNTGGGAFFFFLFFFLAPPSSCGAFQQSHNYT